MTSERKWPKVFRVWRADNVWNAEISFARRPTDDELQALEMLLRDDHHPAPPLPCAAAVSSPGEPNG